MEGLEDSRRTFSWVLDHQQFCKLEKHFISLATYWVFQVFSLKTLTSQVLGKIRAAAVSSKKPVISFTPDWRTFFYNETVTISCHRSPKAPEDETYTWYKNGAKMDVHAQNFTISSIQFSDRANYQCQIGSSSAISDIIRLRVTKDLTILRVPLRVFEGDILNLTCDSRPDMNTTGAQASFSINSKLPAHTSLTVKLIKPMNEETYFYFGKVDTGMYGNYMCTKKALLDNEVKESEAGETIEVTDLFSTPEIKLSSKMLYKGMELTLTCETSLHPLRADTELQFAFYRNECPVQGFGSSNKYIVRYTTMEDPRRYSCEVRTMMNSVRKMSSWQWLDIYNNYRPVLTTNWDKIYKLDTVLIRCITDGRNSYALYKDNVHFKSQFSSIIITAKGDQDVGYYQCSDTYGGRSNRVFLDVVYEDLILQMPPYIHEGDEVTLRCNTRHSGSAVNTTFYKDDKMIKFTGSKIILYLGNVYKNATGKYKCTRVINTDSGSKTYVAERNVSIAELFTTPEIRLNLHPAVEGADMTITCHTSSSPLRYFFLSYAFHKDGKIVQDVGTSKIYKLTAAQMEDSGSYTCEVSSGIIKKISKPVSVNVQGLAVVSFTPNFGKILTTENMTLTCNVDPKLRDKQEYFWYKDGIRMDRTHQSFTIKDAGDSDSGYYQCRSTNTHMSEPLRLDVSNGDLILQAPPLILEGDNLTLTCHLRNGERLPPNITTFYKDDVLLGFPGTGSDLQLGRVRPSMNGIYKCMKPLPTLSIDETSYTAEYSVSVKDFLRSVETTCGVYNRIVGFPLSLSCKVELNPSFYLLFDSKKLEFAFFKDGKKVQDYGTSPSYVVTSALMTHSGKYTCNVKYRSREIVWSSPELEVIVEEICPTPVLKVEPAFIKQGEPMSVICYYSENPDLTYSTNYGVNFKKNGHYYTHYYTHGSYFHIPSTKKSDSGEYQCELYAENPYTGIKVSNTLHIIVEELLVDAKISIDQQDPDMLAGSNITFMCSVHEGTPISVIWFHNDKEIVKNCESSNHQEDGRVLFIGDLRQEHSGVYRCNVSNHFSSSMSDELKITVIEPFLTTDIKDIDLMPEDSITLTCSLTQGRSSKFFWIHNDQNLKQDASRYEFKEGGKVLHIKSAQPDHEGSYQCGVEKEIHPGRTLVSESGIWTLKISSRGGSFLKPFVIVLVVALIFFVSLFIIVVYIYQSKIYKPNFLQRKPQNTRVPKENIQDEVVLLDNEENLKRISSSQN
ncbi:hemicentin-1-like [Engystomops pustulosus]|uniref:hemicentin-1-like n=1 Tax=Engystomops pustulosus TaxID=76066 RepID=UPI003AFA5684